MSKKEIEDRYYRDLKDELEEARTEIDDKYRIIHKEETLGLQEILITLTLVLSISPLFLFVSKLLSALSIFLYLIFNLELIIINNPILEFLVFLMVYLSLVRYMLLKRIKIGKYINKFLKNTLKDTELYSNLRKEKINLRKKSFDEYNKSISNKKK